MSWRLFNVDEVDFSQLGLLVLSLRATSLRWGSSPIFGSHNSLSLPIYSSSPIPKWLLFGYLHPYAEIVSTCYSFGLEKKCLENLCFDLEIHWRRDYWHQGLVVCFLLYSINIYNFWFIFQNVYVDVSFILTLLDLLSRLLFIMLFVLVCFVVSWSLMKTSKLCEK